MMTAAERTKAAGKARGKREHHKQREMWPEAIGLLREAAAVADTISRTFEAQTGRELPKDGLGARIHNFLQRAGVVE